MLEVRNLCKSFGGLKAVSDCSFTADEGRITALIGPNGAGTTDNAKLASWLKARTASSPVKTILGDFHWDKRGLPINRPHLMTQWQGGELKFVYPTGEFAGISKLVYPKPKW